MPHPWDRYIGSMPEPTPVNRLYLAMLGAGLKPISVEDIGKGGRSYGTVTTFACGCERLWHVRIAVPLVETERIKACADHGGLLGELRGGQSAERETHETS